MQHPPPRWHTPAPWARPAFKTPFLPPPREFPTFSNPYLHPSYPLNTFYSPGPAVLDTEQLWLDSFRRTHCCQGTRSNDSSMARNEPPLRLLRRCVAQAQSLALQLKVAATELAAVEKRLDGSQVDMSGMNRSRLRVQHERITATCEGLKKQLEAMNVVSGLFSAKQLAEFRAFAARVNKKKAYRQRLKVRRRKEASIRRVVDVKPFEAEETTEKCTTELRSKQQPEKQNSTLQPDTVEPTARGLIPQINRALAPTLDPETSTLDFLITVRRAWDSYIVLPNTRGASTIPPYFVPVPLTPSAKWAIYSSSAKSKQ